MTTQCSESKLVFHELDSREVEARFDGGEITSDAGGILLREIEKRTGILGRMSECFADHRDPDRIEHTVESLVKQRVLGLCLGYEDLKGGNFLWSKCQDLGKSSILFSHNIFCGVLSPPSQPEIDRNPHNSNNSDATWCKSKLADRDPHS